MALSRQQSARLRRSPNAHILAAHELELDPAFRIKPLPITAFKACVDQSFALIYSVLHTVAGLHCLQRFRRGIDAGDEDLVSRST
ncbi:hypothetical protein QO004_005323 [Rhizobium mesoamericanum]|uniref:hypothetical protein n=1 Tax=Rhizobium mesoamericanum TaxID=1079800 RepID=UPI00278201FF|nr:hypothetical protein [Rhizobium mesoamericanum]MDQ0563514.1 hypothetical protein [Rhizobium mesoamericanum]